MKVFETESIGTLLVSTILLTAALTMVGSGCTSGSSGPSAAPAAGPKEPAKRLGAQGTVDGGGGKGVVCTAADGTEIIKTLDLFESEIVRSEGTDPEISSANTLEDIAVVAVRKLTKLVRDPASLPIPDTELRTLVSGFLKTEFDDRMRPQHTPLSLTTDATLPNLPSNCHVVQIAIWQPSGDIAVDLNFWDKLEVKEKAALKLHEYVYFYARKEGATTSDETRWLIGSAFSSRPLQPRFPESMFVPNAKVLWCYGGGGGAPYDGPNFELYTQEESESGVAGTAFYLHYTRAGQSQAYNAFTRTRAFVAGLALDQLKSGGWPPSIKFQNFLRNYTWSFETTDVPSALKIQDPSGLSGLSNAYCKYQ